ncbi:partitioning defective 3 homolog B-like [Notolabrus celidotus]|uniref:partitioning defective 3 homolog B-like n=1 Tax=Notolabrus celidotus TaxID=1203425 RepID=UPI0014906F27|nr:partitioning defective 3 homolog B-like [Notolabrus celidotus]
MLRSTRQGESVSLGVLRQEDMFLPREMRDDVSRVPVFVPENGKEQLMFEVPLNDSGSAGLGISLKGNKSRETGEDLGIFIKSIIHGGAAYKDGRLCVNDQLVAVNGESLVGRSNHVAMETLRRSMSQEGNVRGTIQLVVLRTLKDQYGVSPNRSFDSSSGLSGTMSPENGPTGMLSQTNGHIHPPMMNNSLYTSSVTNGNFSHMDEDEDGELYGHEPEYSISTQHSSSLQDRENSHSTSIAQPQSPTQNQNQSQRQFQHVKASKSMDLGTTQNQQHTVADESNVGALVGIPAASSAPVELGPTLGLKKSSSLESLQTAMSEVNRKNDYLPFHRPRQNMVRGRGCNESFRAAIDKSYDGPAEDEDDDDSEQSSGRDTPASGSSRQGAGDRIEEKGKKDKKKKAKSKKKEKNKGKGKEKEKEKEKKKAVEPEETEKKSKKIGFGLLRFGKKKDEKKEAKAALQRQKSDILTDHEFERMREERERIEAAHPELREQRSKDQQLGSGGMAFPDVEDDDADPNYARIQTFRDRDPGSVPQPMSQSPPYSTIQHTYARTPSPQGPPAFPGHGTHGNNPGAVPDDNHIDRLYAKVNKQRGGAGTASPPVPATGNESVDRIQQLRREYQQARREGVAPPYEEDLRRRGHENDAHRMPGRGPDPRLAPRYEEVERQYASLPRRGPLEPADHVMQPWSGHYPAAPQAPQAYPQSPSYHNPNPGPPYSGYTPSQQYARPVDPRGMDPGYYPHPSTQQRGPLRQDVPPSPIPPLRGLRYDTMTRGTGGGGYRHMVDHSPDQYGYIKEGGRQQQQHQTNQRQKNAMTAAV